MKKLLTTLVLLFFVLTTFGQYELYKCTQMSTRKIEKKRNKDEWSKWSPNAKVNIIIRIDNDEMKLEFEDKQKTVIHLSRLLDEKKDTDEDGDLVILQKWTAFDQDGLELHFGLMDYPGFANRDFMLDYETFSVFLGCHVIN